MERLNIRNDLIVLPIGKILIIRKNERKEFFKLKEDNTVVDLNEEEKKYIDNIFNSTIKPVVYSESILDIIKENKNENLEKEFWLSIIQAIDEHIPEGAKGIFHRNLRTLKIETGRSSNVYIEGEYNIPENRIIIETEYKDYLIENPKISDIVLEISDLCIHEFLHAASSEDDNGIYRCGLRVSSQNGKITSVNEGLNEGVTEMLTEDITQGMYGKVAERQQTSAYLKERLIAKQLRHFCPDEIKEGYFKAKGIQKLKKSMKKYYQYFCDEQEEDVDFEVDSLFDRIEDLYKLREYENEENFQSMIPLQIQNLLLTALEGEILRKIQIGILKTEEEVEKYLDLYGENLLTPKKLHLQPGEEKKFLGLEMVSIRFEGIKEKYKQMIADRKQQNTLQHNKVVITPQQIEQVTENATISSISNETIIAENVIETPDVNTPEVK